MLEEQQINIRKMQSDYDDDKINWNKQHQEHLLSIEVVFFYLFMKITILFKLFAEVVY